MPSSHAAPAVYPLLDSVTTTLRSSYWRITCHLPSSSPLHPLVACRELGFLNISFEMILYFDQQISIRPHFIYQNILIKIQNLKLSAKTQMSSHSHPTDPDTVAHRTSAVSIAPHLELSQDAGTIRSLAPFSPQPACCSSASVEKLLEWSIDHCDKHAK